MWKRILLVLMFVGLLVWPASSGQTVKRGPGSSTVWEMSFDLNDAGLNPVVPACISKQNAAAILTCGDVRNTHIIPDNHTLVITQFYVRVLAALTSGGEDCNISLQYGTNNDYSTGATDIVTIQAGNASTPDLKDSGDTSTTALNQTLVAGSWIRVLLEARAVCTGFASASIRVNGILY